MKAVKNKSVVQAVIDEIIFQIKKGELKPGDKIHSQRELAKNLKVGRSCIREALQALSLANIIKIKPGKGAFISELSVESIMNPAKVQLSINQEDLLDLINVRLILETAAIREAVQKATADDIDKLLSNINNTKLCIRDNKSDLYYFEDYEFHKTIFSCTRNKILISIFDFIFEMFIEGIKATAKVPGSKHRGLKWHREIYRKIKNKDIDGAEKALRNHILQIKKDVYNADAFTNQGKLKKINF
ncbi:MAG: FadR/GntR family transcriptional regulator [Actinomycetota bacterium]